MESTPKRRFPKPRQPRILATIEMSSSTDIPMIILIVEDNEAMRHMIRALIGPIAETIHECGDGLAAVESYVRFHPDWVVMDIDLPRMDGLSATRQIIACDPEAKILMLTNFDESDMRWAADEAGARGYILKDDLLAVRTFLQGQ